MDDSIKITVDEIKSKIAAEFPTGVKVLDRVKPRRIYMTADRDVLFKLCTFLRDQLTFDQSSCVAGVDRLDRFQVVHHITSYSNNCTIELTVDIPRDDPRIDSVTPLWEGANWNERETYDMYGIIFTNHPRLERILLPADYKFFPMRKDFVVGRE